MYNDNERKRSLMISRLFFLVTFKVVKGRFFMNLFWDIMINDIKQESHTCWEEEWRDKGNNVIFRWLRKKLSDIFCLRKNFSELLLLKCHSKCYFEYYHTLFEFAKYTNFSKNANSILMNKIEKTLIQKRNSNMVRRVLGKY